MMKMSKKKGMGLSDEAAEQITTAYGKQAEEKINKYYSCFL